MVWHADGVHGHCDATTVYRTLMMFKEAELVRLVGTPHKVNHFVLNVPGENNYFLICRRCGCITELPLPQPMADAIGRVAAAQGFALTRQDCEVYGLCEPCQATTPMHVAPSNLML
jgi:Fe2+ or Zn2+ uptake regulation protein